MKACHHFFVKYKPPPGTEGKNQANASQINFSTSCVKLCLIRPPFLVDNFLFLQNNFTCPRGKVQLSLLAIVTACASDTSIICMKAAFIPALQAALELHSALLRCPFVHCEMHCTFSTQTLSSTEITSGSLKLPLPTKHCLSLHHLHKKDAESLSGELRKARKNH